jgi:predicted MFS family arabinose efflux permease
MITTETQTATRWLAPFVGTLAAMFALQMSNLGFSPLLPSIQYDFAMSFTQLGLFTGIYGLLAIALSVPAGLAARSLGEKPTVIAGLLGVAVGSLLLGSAWSFPTALASRGITIVGYRFAFVCVLVAVAVTSPPSLKGRTMGVVGATSSLASVVGAPVGGMLERTLGWRTGILGYAAAAVVGAVVFALLYPRRAASQSEHVDVHVQTARAAHGKSAFKSPLVWLLALLVGLGGFGQFTVTYFVPSVARSVFNLDAVAAGWIISTGFLCAIVVNLGVGALMDRYDKWMVLAGMFALLAIASASVAVQNLLIFRLSTAAVLSLGFTAANQLYGIAGTVTRGRETGNAIGVVSLGAGLFGYFGPQMLGILRDWTGGFAAGFYMVAAADVMTLILIILAARIVGPIRGPSEV